MDIKRIRLPIFTHGKEVIYQDLTRIVDYTFISQGNLFVKLYNVFELIDSKSIICQDSVFEYQIEKGRIIVKT